MLRRVFMSSRFFAAPGDKALLTGHAASADTNSRSHRAVIVLVPAVAALTLLVTGCSSQESPQEPKDQRSDAPAVSTEPPAELTNYFDGLATGSRRGMQSAIESSAPDSPARAFAQHQLAIREALRGDDAAGAWSSSVSVEMSEVFWDSSIGSSAQESYSFSGFHYDSAGRLKDWVIDAPGGSSVSLGDSIATVADREKKPTITLRGGTAYKPPASELQVTYSASSSSTDSSITAESYLIRGKKVSPKNTPYSLEPESKATAYGFSILKAGGGGRLSFSMDDYNSNRFDDQGSLKIPPLN